MDDKKFMKYQLNVFNYNYLPWVPHNWFYNIRNFFRNIGRAWQRALYGYCDADLWNFDTYLTYMISHGLENLAENHCGYPGCPPVDTSEAWTAMLKDIAQYLKESEEQYDEKFLWINPLQEKSDLLDRKMTTEKTEDGHYRVNFNLTVDEEKLKHDWYNLEIERGNLRASKKDYALDLIKQYWFNLWD